MAVGMSKTLVVGFGLLVCLLLHCEEANGKEYIVGDEKGWNPDPNISNWPHGKNFKAGDVLIFKYNNQTMDVFATILKWAYDECDAYAGAHATYSSGNDHVVLENGTIYFAPNNGPYCKNGMKIAVDVQ